MSTNYNLQLLERILPGRYQRSMNDSSSSSSLWSEGELFSLKRNNCYRFLNKANAYWSFRIITTSTDDDDNENENENKNSFAMMTNSSFMLQGGSMKYRGEVFESPDSTWNDDQQDEEDDDENQQNKKSSCLSFCEIEVTRELLQQDNNDDNDDENVVSVDGQSYSVSFKLIDDGQVFVRCRNLDSFPLATNFLSSSLGYGSVSLATRSLRESIELQLRAQREYFSSSSSSSSNLAPTKFTETLNELRSKYPIGSLKWKQNIKFVKQDGPWYEHYCLVRMLDLIDRQQQKRKEITHNNTFNITVIAISKTETNVPESFQEFLQMKSEDFEDEDRTVTRELDERLLNASPDEDEEHECEEDRVFLNNISSSSSSRVDFDSNVPSAIRSMLFWWSEFVAHLGDGNFSKTRVRYQVFDEAAMELFFDDNDDENEKTEQSNISDENDIEDDHNKQLMFPQFPWEKLKRTRNDASGIDYDDTDQFIVIYPRAEPSSWSLSALPSSTTQKKKESSSSSTSPDKDDVAVKKSRQRRFSVSGLKRQQMKAEEEEENQEKEQEQNEKKRRNKLLAINPRFTTSGITLSPTGRPVAVLDDRSLFEPDKCPGLEFNHCLRSAYYSHWLLHETSHAWYECRDDSSEHSSNPFLYFGGREQHPDLEPFSHSWFDRKNWPKDFESESGLEEDYFFEAIEKRFLVSNNNEDNDISSSFPRKNWPFWAKLKHHPRCLQNNQSHTSCSFIGDYRSVDSMSSSSSSENDFDFISVFKVVGADENEEEAVINAIKWQTRMKEIPITLYRIDDDQIAGDDPDIVRFSSLQSSSNSNLSASSTISKEITVCFRRLLSFNVNSQISWTASVFIAGNAFPSTVFLQTEQKPDQVYKNENDEDEDDEIALAHSSASRRRRRVATEQQEQRKKKNQALRPNQDKIGMVFEGFAELREHGPQANKYVTASLAIAAIMNSLLPFVNTIKVTVAVKKYFENSSYCDDSVEGPFERVIDETDFRELVNGIFDDWIEEQNKKRK